MTGSLQGACSVAQVYAGTGRVPLTRRWQDWSWRQDRRQESQRGRIRWYIAPVGHQQGWAQQAQVRTV